jgi:hypothetical protein
MKLIGVNWWTESPIDYNHKKSILLNYLQKLDKEFYDLNFSPWLLHSEKMLDDMKNSLIKIKNVDDYLIKERVIISENYLYIDKDYPIDNKMETFKSILNYSIPLLDNKVDFGRQLWSENRTILW